MTTHVENAHVTKKSTVSLIWLIPVLALMLAAWMIYRDYQSAGLLVDIEFESAEGLQAGDTKVKLKNVEIGVVEAIKLSDDLSNVIVSARINESAKSYINESTTFWVERARVSIDGVSGLSTLLSGAYISLNTSINNSEKKTSFIGLDQPPSLSISEQGTVVQLYSANLDTLSIGAPIYYRNIEVGKVEQIEFSDDYSLINIRTFILKPYDKLINESTKFWRVSGVSAQINADGVDIQLNSLSAMIHGAISFENVVNTQTSDEGLLQSTQEEVIPKSSIPKKYVLYDSYSEINEIKYIDKEYFVLYFDQSIRGLEVGAPVEFRGVKIGSVKEINTKQKSVSEIVFPVVIEIEPERLGLTPFKNQQSDEAQRVYLDLFSQGLRASLQSGNMLTGKMLIGLDIYPNEPEVTLNYEGTIPVMPTIVAGFGQITNNLNDVLGNANKLLIKLQKIDSDQWSEEISDILKSINNMSAKTDKQLSESLDKLNTLMSNANLMIESFSEGSATRYDIDQTLKAVKNAAQSVQSMAETIDNKPNSVIFGKEE